MTTFNAISLKDSANIDAFARLRVSEPVNQFDSQMQYDLQPLQWESILTGGGTITWTESK